MFTTTETEDPGVLHNYDRYIALAEFRQKFTREGYQDVDVEPGVLSLIGGPKNNGIHFSEAVLLEHPNLMFAMGASERVPLEGDLIVASIADLLREIETLGKGKGADLTKAYLIDGDPIKVVIPTMEVSEEVAAGSTALLENLGVVVDSNMASGWHQIGEAITNGEKEAENLYPIVRELLRNQLRQASRSAVQLLDENLQIKQKPQVLVFSAEEEGSGLEYYNRVARLAQDLGTVIIFLHTMDSYTHAEWEVVKPPQASSVEEYWTSVENERHSTTGLKSAESERASSLVAGLSQEQSAQHPSLDELFTTLRSQDVEKLETVNTNYVDAVEQLFRSGHPRSLELLELLINHSEMLGALSPDDVDHYPGFIAAVDRAYSCLSLLADSFFGDRDQLARVLNSLYMKLSNDEQQFYKPLSNITDVLARALIRIGSPSSEAILKEYMLNLFYKKASQLITDRIFEEMYMLYRYFYDDIPEISKKITVVPNALV